MNFLEKDLEDIIFNTPNHLLKERGLPIKGKKIRQLALGNYGRADIVTIEKGYSYEWSDWNDWAIAHGESEKLATYPELNITIYELKQNKVNFNSLGQAIRYAKGIDEYLSFNNKLQKINIKYRFVLIGKEIDLGDFCFLPDFFDELSIYSYSYLFDGIRFTGGKEYRFIDGFKNIKPF